MDSNEWEKYSKNNDRKIFFHKKMEEKCRRNDEDKIKTISAK